jgi:two-component system, NarL family, response regulator LiaR
MNFIFTRQYLVVVAKYAFALGVAVFLFGWLKQGVYISLNSWDTYATIVAALFLVAGIWLGRRHTLDELPAEENYPTSVEELLSRRETEVYQMLLLNKTNQQIADEMCIELSTLKTHINKIYKKTGVKNRQQLMVRSKRLGN